MGGKAPWRQGGTGWKGRPHPGGGRGWPWVPDALGVLCATLPGPGRWDAFRALAAGITAAPGSQAGADDGHVEWATVGLLFSAQVSTAPFCKPQRKGILRRAQWRSLDLSRCVVPRFRYFPLASSGASRKESLTLLSSLVYTKRAFPLGTTRQPAPFPPRHQVCRLASVCRRVVLKLSVSVHGLCTCARIRVSSGRSGSAVTGWWPP